MLSRIFFEPSLARLSFRDRTLKLNPAIANEYFTFDCIDSLQGSVYREGSNDVFE